MNPTNSKSVVDFSNPLERFSLSRLILVFIMLFAAALTTAYTGLLEIGSNRFGFPFAWKIRVSQESVFQVFDFIIDVAFWSVLYSSVLAGLTILLRQFRRGTKRTNLGDRFG